MVIGFTYNVRHTKPGLSKRAQDEAEFDEPTTIKAISDALVDLGHEVIPIEANQFVYKTLYKNRKKIQLVFNQAEGLHGDIREAQIPAMLEMLTIPYTHSRALTHAISLNKELTKHVWRGKQLKTPASFRISSDMPLSSLPELTFPVVVKPNSEGSSKGIFDQSVVKKMKEMKEAVKNLRELLGGDVLVEEFLPGREFTVTVMGNKGIGDDVFVLPPVEQNYEVFPSSMNKLASYEAKWFFEDNLPNPHDAYICPPKLKKRLYKEIEQLCIHAYNALECRDIARIDLRLDREDNPSLLEINTIPGMIPDEHVVSYYPVAARTLGWSYNMMVGKIVDLALERRESRFS